MADWNVTRGMCTGGTTDRERRLSNCRIRVTWRTARFAPGVETHRVTSSTCSLAALAPFRPNAISKSLILANNDTKTECHRIIKQNGDSPFALLAMRYREYD